MDEKINQNIGTNLTRLTLISAPALLSLILGIVISIGLFSLVRGWERQIIEAEFELSASTYATDLKGEINRHLEGVASIASFFNSSRLVTRDEFNTFVGGYQGKHVDIQALAWIPKVTAAERESLEKQAVQEGLSNFRITEQNDQGRMVNAGPRAEYFPITFISPHNGNEIMLGYDLASDDSLWRDLELSRSNGSMLVSKRMKPLQGDIEQYVVFILAPVYQRDAVIDTPQQRYENLLGFAAEIMFIESFIEEALQESAVLGIDVLLTDETAVASERYLYYHEQYSPDHLHQATVGEAKSWEINEDNIRLHLDAPGHKAGITWQRVMEIPGRSWRLEFYPAEDYLDAHYIWTSRAVLVGCLLLTAFLTFYVDKKNRYRHNVEALMQELESTNDHLEDEIGERKHIEKVLSQVAQAVSKKTSEEFFISLVRNLTSALRVEYAFIGEIIGEDGNGLEMVAVCKNGEIVDNFRCPLVDTLCGEIVKNGVGHISHGLQPEFSKNCRLCDSSVEGYLGVPIHGSNGVLLGIVGIMSKFPMTSNQPAEAVLHFYAEQIAGELERRQSEIEMKKLSSALKQAGDIVVITDRAGIIEYVNPTFEAVTGYSSEEVLGKTSSMLKSGKHNEKFYKNLWNTLLRGDSYQGILINQKRGGELYYEEKTITPVKDRHGEIINYISTGKDITERVEDQKRLQHLAYHDALTGLPNRILLMDRLEHSLIRRTKSKYPMAVMFLDLDRFKNINDTLGHNVGDLLLQNITKRLIGCIREEDTIARLGGDEFAILLENITSVEDIVQINKKILNALVEPFIYEGQELFVSGSIGVSIHPEDGTDASTLLMNADTAMYRAKALGRNNYQFYSPDMSAMALDHLKLESSLRRAIERQEFLLHYQPQIAIATGQIIGAEALIRWVHPERGLVAPLEFVPLLEETGLIGPVGEWVLRTACEQAKHWHTTGFDALRISANLSGRQFQDPKLVKIISDILEETALDPSQLELEITESVLMQGDKTSMSNLHTLKQMGLHLAIDDFGTGYSSLSYLKRFPITTLKIDREFIRDINTDEDDAAIVKTIVAMAHNLKMQVVAEGVETEHQFNFLKQCGCGNMQGNLFSTPVPGEDMLRLLQDNRSSVLPSASGVS